MCICGRHRPLAGDLERTPYGKREVSHPSATLPTPNRSRARRSPTTSSGTATRSSTRIAGTAARAIAKYRQRRGRLRCAPGSASRRRFGRVRQAAGAPGIPGRRCRAHHEDAQTWVVLARRRLQMPLEEAQAEGAPSRPRSRCWLGADLHLAEGGLAAVPSRQGPKSSHGGERSFSPLKFWSRCADKGRPGTTCAPSAGAHSDRCQALARCRAAANRRLARLAPWLEQIGLAVRRGRTGEWPRYQGKRANLAQRLGRQGRIAPFLLHHDGGLAEAPPAEGAAPLSWDSDPRHPVPTIGGAITSMEPVCSGGPYDQRERPEIFGCRPPYPPLASRADVLVEARSPGSRRRASWPAPPPRRRRSWQPLQVGTQAAAESRSSNAAQRFAGPRLCRPVAP